MSDIDLLDLSQKINLYNNFKTKNLSKAHTVSRLGSGVDAIVHKMRYKNYFFARKMMKALSRIYPGAYVNNMIEQISHELINELVLQKASPNFALMYHFGNGKFQSFIDMELLQDAVTLKEFASDIDLPFKEYMSIIFQIFSGLYVLQKHFNFVQNDLHFGNIMIEQLPQKYDEIYFEYTIEGKKYYVPSYGVRVVIIDFGSAKLKGKLSARDFVTDYAALIPLFREISQNNIYFEKSILEFFRVAVSAYDDGDRDPLHVEDIISVLFDTPSRDPDLLEKLCGPSGYPCFDIVPYQPNLKIESFDCDKPLNLSHLSSEHIRLIEHGMYHEPHALVTKERYEDRYELNE